MRSVVDLPQPDGPDQHDEFLVGDVEIDGAHGLDIIVVLDDLAKRDLRHDTQPFVAPAVSPAM